jgi:hypothetical protein
MMYLNFKEQMSLPKLKTIYSQAFQSIFLWKRTSILAFKY